VKPSRSQLCRASLALLLAAAGACSVEKASRYLPDAGALDHTVADVTGGEADRESEDAAGAPDGGAADHREDTDAGQADARLDAGQVDADAGADGGVDDADAGSDHTDASGDALPSFVRVWAFDQPSLMTDGWATSFGLAGSTLMYDPAVGSPSPGSLVLNVPFSSPNGGEQYFVQVQVTADLTHRHVSATFRLESGGPAQGRVGYSSTSSYVLVSSPPVTIAPGVWTTLTLDVDNPPSGSFIDMSHPGLDGGVIPPTPADTRVIAVGVNTPYAGGTYTPAVIHVDTVGYY